MLAVKAFVDRMDRELRHKPACLVQVGEVSSHRLVKLQPQSA
jgi:hypothetical protein